MGGGHLLISHLPCYLLVSCQSLPSHVTSLAGTGGQSSNNFSLYPLLLLPKSQNNGAAVNSEDFRPVIFQTAGDRKQAAGIVPALRHLFVTCQWEGQNAEEAAAATHSLASSR